MGSETMPVEVIHVDDDRGENFRVTYIRPQLIHDGIHRKTFWYRCRFRGTQVGTAKHCEGHERAERAAWKHIETVLSRGGAVAIV